MDLNRACMGGSLKIYLFLIFSFLFLVFPSRIHSQENSQALEHPLFQSDEIIHLRMAADFKEVFLNNDDVTYFPAKLILSNGANQNIEFEIQIRTRGNTRRMTDICLFPPLRLQFKEEEVKQTIFDGQKNIKLVTHCKKASSNEQNTIIEYLIYKAYNLLTDSSLKVRPAIINYVNLDRKPDSVQRFAFFIEREKYLAERINAIELADSIVLHPNRLNPLQMNLMDLFQYMIGNTDYSAYTRHNTVLITDKQQKFLPIAIPYDFDFSGLVLALYAVPNPMFQTTSVKERVFRGFKKPIELIKFNILLFQDKKKEIYDLFNNFEMLSKSERKRILKYLDEFYEIINNEELVKREFVENARILHN